MTRARDHHTIHVTIPAEPRPVIVIGIPRPCYERLLKGETFIFDEDAPGDLPVDIHVVAGPTFEVAKFRLEKEASECGATTEDFTGTDKESKQ